MSKIRVSHNRRRAMGPLDTFDYFVDAPAGWAFFGSDGTGYHYFACEDEFQADLSAEAHAEELAPCRCGCASEVADAQG